MTRPLRIGILALQGAVQPHRAKLARLGAEPVLVRDARELETCAGLILPGGESTTMLHLIHAYALWQPLLDFAAARPLWGVCAGSILMAARVEHPSQESLAVVPITVRRNAYGRQVDSFEAEVDWKGIGLVRAIFIRAPRIERIGAGVEVVAEHGSEPVAVRSGAVTLTAFHPELTDDHRIHRAFVRG